MNSLLFLGNSMRSLCRRWLLPAALVCLLAGCGKPGQNASTGPASSGGNGTAQPPMMNRPIAEHGLFTYLLPLDQLRPRQDAILSDLTGTVGEGMLGRVHDLRSDEDLHFALEAPEMQTPVVCELMNARSQPDAAITDKEYWPQQFTELFANGTVTVRGVFRIWPDHAAVNEESGAEMQGTATSNPPHVVEMHPIAGLLQGRRLLDTRANIAPITFEGRAYPYKDPGRWGDMMSHTISTRVVQNQGRDYLELQTPQIGFNYWRLRLQIVDAPANAGDGHRFTARVVSPTRVYREPVRCFTVAATQADRDVTALQPGYEVPVVAIGRFDLATLLQPGGYQGPPPVELCVFGINPPDLPSEGRSGEGGMARSRREETRAAELSASAPAGDTSAPYIGNARTHVYHDARSANLPSPRNRVYFRSREEAEAAGYRPARDVQP